MSCSTIRARGVACRTKGGALATAAALAALVCGRALADEAVPPPARTPARVIVSGRTSTAKEVKIVAVGQHIPRTYSGRELSNAPGFSWYVSEHYALKTDYEEKKARFYLTLLELAYPHYVELFGAEPPGIHDRRMAVVYASSEKKWHVAMKSDGIDWRGGGGGVTILRNRVAYVYPSGTLNYHQRYILLHECAHAFQMCLTGTTYTTPGWYREGIADSIGSHVYDTSRQQLTVHVLDKATTNNHFDQGLRSYAKEPLPLQEIHAKGGGGRGLGFLIVHYFNDEPDRAQRFRIWRDEMFRLAPQGQAVRETSSRLLEQLFGPWSQLNASFEKWIEARQNTFHYAEWGWEQEGNTLWSYGFAPDGKLSRTDAYLIPNEKPTYDPLRMDYPAEEMPPIVGPVERGVAEPSVGAVVDFSRHPDRGRAGIGLGLVADAAPKPHGLKIVIERSGELTMDGVDFGIKKKVVQLPDELRNALKAAGRRFEMTTTITRKALEVALRVGDPKTRKPAEFKAALPINEQQRQRLLAGAKPSLNCLKLLVERSKKLTVDGADLGIKKKAVPIPDEFRQAMRAGGQRIGMTVKIASKALEVALRAGDPNTKPVEVRASVPISEQQRERLLSKPLTILARDGWHGVTPFFDDRRRLEPDLSVPAPPNRWRNPGDKPLAALYKACWRLGKHAPASLTALRQEMLAAVTQGPDVQKQALADFHSKAVAICQAVRECGAEREAIGPSLADLVGLSLRLAIASDAAPNHVQMTAVLRGPLVGKAEGTMRFLAEPASILAATPEPESLSLPATRKLIVKRVYRLTDLAAPFHIVAQADLAWRGEEIVLGMVVAGRPSIPAWWVIGPFSNPGGDTKDIAHPPERGPVDLGKNYPGIGGQRVAWHKVERDPSLDVAAEHLVDFIKLFGQRENAAAYALTWLESPREMDAVIALGSDDGVVVWLNGKRVHANLVPRGYSPKADRVPIRLRAGRNQLLVKITQGMGDWSFCGHLEDANGNPLRSVTARLEGGK